MYRTILHLDMNSFFASVEQAASPFLCGKPIVVIGDMSKYVYTSKNIFRMMVDYTDKVEVLSIDEAFLDITDTQNMFGGPVAIALDIKKRIKDRKIFDRNGDFYF